MKTSEVATFFGPDHSPLFGVLHLPEDNQIRGGVVICGSIGRQGITSVRFQRILASTLAERGFAVLRFDYLGTGDSAYTQDHDDAIENWQHSIECAVEYLNTAGAKSVTAVALRAGGLILGDVLNRPRLIDRVAYVDPVETGRRYLREQAALFMVSAGADSLPAGDISIIGGRLTAAAAAKFRKLRLNVDQSDVIDHLLVVRSDAPEDQISGFAHSERLESAVVDLLPEFSQPAQTMTPIPLGAVDAIVEWADKKESLARTTAVPRYLRTVRMPVDGSRGADVVIESIESIGPGGLFAIRTRPVHSVPGDGTVWVFCTSANDPHVGPAREWVELSRHVAEVGAQAVRWDRSGIGESPPVSREQWQPVYTRSDVQDAIAVAAFAANDSRDLHLIGSCSGSWYAAHAARALGAGQVVLVNPRVWTWRIGVTAVWQWWNLKRPLRAAASLRQPGGGSRITAFRKKATFVASRELKKTGHRYGPAFALKGLGHLGVAQSPDVILSTLSDGRAAAIVLLSPWDSDLFDQRCGRRAITRLERASLPPRLITIGEGDHALYHQTMLQAIRDVVLESVSASHRGAVPHRTTSR